MSDQDQIPNADELFQSALQSGDISPPSALLLTGLSNRINRIMGTVPARPTVTDQTQLCMLLDNTPSMEYNKNHLAVIEGHNLVVNALLTARAVNSVESLTMLINPNRDYTRNITGATDEFLWGALKCAPRLDKRGFISGSATPLYDRCLEVLGCVLARTKWWEDNYGVQTRSVTLLMTDGQDNDSKRSAKDVAQVVRDMLAAEKHRIFFLGVQSAGTDFMEIGREIGLPDDYITVVERDPKAIRAKFQLFSQSAIAVAQSANNCSTNAGFGRI